ncbi:hypothetical protein DOY81_001858, partial [Sarcophaga bullata]
KTTHRTKYKIKGKKKNENIVEKLQKKRNKNNNSQHYVADKQQLLDNGCNYKS